jgi:hypothetical protein
MLIRGRLQAVTELVHEGLYVEGALSGGAPWCTGEGSWLRLWQLDSQLISQGQTNMAPAKYKGLGFPDIVQLAFPDTACQLIAGCSSTGLLAVWSIR